jgi:chromosome segregation ATPase
MGNAQAWLPFFQSTLPVVMAILGAAWLHNGRLGTLESSINRRFDEVDRRIGAVERRLERLETKVDDIDRRLTRLEERSSPLTRA